MARGWRESAAGPETTFKAPACTWARSRMSLLGVLWHVSDDDATSPDIRKRLGSAAAIRARPAYPQHDRRRHRRDLQRTCTFRARTSHKARDPNTQHITAGLSAMECVVVQDLFLNETASFAHVFLPGSTFLEKDGTFTNAERRLGRVRRAVAPANGYADWEITMKLSEALGYPMHYNHPSEIMDEIARLTPSFAGVSYEKLEEVGSVQWPCNEKAPEGTPIMHIGGFVRGKGRFMLTEFVPTEERVTRRFPLILTTGRILTQYNVGAQTARTENNVWHPEDLLEIHPEDAADRGIKEGDLVSLTSRAGETSSRRASRSACNLCGLYHVPSHVHGANVVTTEFSDWATGCPEYKVTAVPGAWPASSPNGSSITLIPASRPHRWQMRLSRQVGGEKFR